jgi:putative transposase
MDFVSDCMAGGRTIRALTLVDDYTRECLAIEVDTSLGGLRVRRVLEAVLEKRGKPEVIVVDYGPEFRGRALAGWSEERRVGLQFIEPGKPCLNANWFLTLADARRKIEVWRQDLPLRDQMHRLVPSIVLHARPPYRKTRPTCPSKTSRYDILILAQ